jgi:hypothetical protein
MTRSDPFKGFQSSPEIIRLAVMLYVRFPLSLRNVEDLLHERGIEISHESAMKRFGSGGTGLVRCLLLKSGNAGSKACGPVDGGGISTRCS